MSVINAIFDPPRRFYEIVTKRPIAPYKLVAALRAVGFDVYDEGRDSGYWRAYVEKSVNRTVEITERAFAGADAAQFAYLAWHVHNDDAVQAAYRLGGVVAASALLTSEWVNAQDHP